jgi:hypothetical protein
MAANKEAALERLHRKQQAQQQSPQGRHGSLPSPEVRRPGVASSGSAAPGPQRAPPPPMGSVAPAFALVVADDSDDSDSDDSDDLQALEPIKALASRQASSSPSSSPVAPLAVSDPLTAARLSQLHVPVSSSKLASPWVSCLRAALPTHALGFGQLEGIADAIVGHAAAGTPSSHLPPYVSLFGGTPPSPDVPLRFSSLISFGLLSPRPFSRPSLSRRSRRARPRFAPQGHGAQGPPARPG